MTDNLTQTNEIFNVPINKEGLSEPFYNYENNDFNKIGDLTNINNSQNYLYGEHNDECDGHHHHNVPIGDYSSLFIIVIIYVVIKKIKLWKNK